MTSLPAGMEPGLSTLLAFTIVVAPLFAAAAQEQRVSPSDPPPSSSAQAPSAQTPSAQDEPAGEGSAPRRGEVAPAPSGGSVAAPQPVPPPPIPPRFELPSERRARQERQAHTPAPADEPAVDATPSSRGAEEAPPERGSGAAAAPPVGSADTARAAAWSVGTSDWRALVDVRGFYHYTEGRQRADRKGGEVLSYFDAFDGLGGAALARVEARDEIGAYGSIMLVPRYFENQYLVSSVGLGNGVDFFPLVRLDVQARGFLPEPIVGLMYDVGFTASWWKGSRHQLAQSNAVIWWYEEIVLELRETTYFTDPGSGPWRVNVHGQAVVLWGKHGARWFTGRVLLGDGPENLPGVAVAAMRDAFFYGLMAGYRHWIGARYGVAVEVEALHQVDVWFRIGLTTSVFLEI